MNKKVITLFVFLSVAQIISAQTEEKSTELNIAKSLDLFIFPGEGQDKKTQEMDEFECYKWAMSESEVDPMNLKEKTKDAAADQPQGDAVKGAAKGAALGAAIGGVTGDAGEGAAVGAIGGSASGMKRRRMKKQAKAQKAQQEDQAYKSKQMDSFKRAFQACMIAKGYTIN